MSQTVLEMWQDFERQVLPRDAGQVQRREMRRAFYAGALASFVNLSSIAAGREEVALHELNALVSEGAFYLRDLATGKA